MKTFEYYPGLSALPPLVRKQRRLEKQLAPLAQLEKDEKAVRERIDALLKAEGLGNGEGVECLGYDVVHHEHKGNSFISRELLLAAGVPAETIDKCIDRYKPKVFATVNPAKGAKVRAA